MTEATPEYRFNEWSPIRAVDMIPIVGFITQLDRLRRLEGMSVKQALADSFKEVRRPLQWLLIGTADWPKPSDGRAFLRAQALMARNTAFYAYHITSPAWGYVLYRRIVSGVSAVIENLSNIKTLY